ncbi:MAG TPA: hypothetical protein VJ302_05695, partial [Blastocatellia bacterium]|nr:hypothetical protein [Blastocatellia bacterium]
NNQDVATAALGSLVGSLGRYSKPLLGHIFRDAVGHVNPSTLGARAGYMKLFEAVATKPTNYRSNFPLPAAAAKAGVEAYTQVFRNGKQVWVYTRNGKIIDAGVNLPGAHR